MNQYTTAAAPTPHKLDAIVNDLLKQGFQPYGSPYSVSKSDNPICCQAMLKTSTGPQPKKSSISLLLESEPSSATTPKMARVEQE